MTCCKCSKYISYRDGNYAKWKFGMVTCLKCSPMEKYGKDGKLKAVQKELVSAEETSAETTRIEDIPIM